jgi:apolipoprotein N-acyltransferase
MPDKLTSMLADQRADSKTASLLSLCAGALMTLAYQPFGVSVLVFPLLALFLLLLTKASPKWAFVHAGLFSLGAQLTGICWIFFSLYYHGGSPAALAVLMIFLLSAYLSLYFALAVWAVNRYCRAPIVLRLLLLYPVAWMLAELASGFVMTGFAWMQPGYTQIDLPLAGYAPVLGSHGVGALVVVCSGALAAVLVRRLSWQKGLALVAMIWLVGFGLHQVAWTDVQDTDIRVALVQGNVPQKDKWKREMHEPTLKLYRDLTEQQRDVDLVIWPETAVPDYRHRVPAYLLELRQSMQRLGADLLLGIFIRDEEGRGYYNTLLDIRGEYYSKRHLVPLGEYIPLRSVLDFFDRWIHIPMSDIAAGDKDQPLLHVAGQDIGVSICFEDAFARDVRRDLPRATLLVNVSNDAWFDGSHEAWQHHAIARMRALETGRYLLRATNTGVTSVIGPHGEVLAIAPRFETTVLRAVVKPASGSTPYVFWGDGAALALAALGVGVCLLRGRQRRAEI